MMRESKISRRKFFSGILGTSMALLCQSCRRERVLPLTTSSNAETKQHTDAKWDNKRTRIVVVRSRRYVATGTIDIDEARKMLKEGIVRLTGSESTKDAWKHFFDPDEMIGIKVNCLAGARMSTHPQIAYAVAMELMGIGVKGERILIWDRSNRELENAGFKVATADKPLCFGTDTDGIGYDEDVYEFSNVGSLVSRIVTRLCTAFVNMPVVKDHGIVGYTGALKNWLGAVHNPNKYHSDRGDPQIAELSAFAEIKDKQRLIVCDALDVQYHGGPSFKPQFVVRHGAIIISTDPVAVDIYGWNLVEGYRKKRGLKSLESEGRKPTYILTAAKEPLRLGYADQAMVDVIEIEM
jgi:uncharacterized protein (DUF362 family)